MKKTIRRLIIVNLIVNLLFWSIPPYREHYQAPEPPPKPPQRDLSVDLTPREYIALYAEKYLIDSEKLLKTAICESGLNPRAINYNDGGKGKHSVGILQFQESTFLAWEKKFGEDLNYYSYHDQIKLGAYMFSKGQIGQWSCARILNLV